MKNSIKNILFLFVVSAVFISCSQNDEVYTAMDIDRFTEIVTTGNWRVSNYDGESPQLPGYSISFGLNNNLNANNGSESAIGSWNVWLNDDGDGEFSIYFSTVNDLQALNNTWSVISYSNDKIEFYGSENSGVLTLSRN